MKSISIVTFIFVTLTFMPGAFAQMVSQTDLPEGVKARIGKGEVRSFAYSPDGGRLACARPTGIWMYNAHTGEQISQLVTSGVEYISFSPDGRTLAGCGRYSDTVLLWDANTGGLKGTLESKGEHFGHVVYSPDGSTLAVISNYETVRLWNVAPGQPNTSFTLPVESPAIIRFSPDGRTLAVGGMDVINLWDVNTRSLKATLGESGWTDGLEFSPDDLTLAILSSEKNEVGIYESKVTFWDTTTGKLKVKIKPPRYVNGIAYSLDGRTLTGCMGSGAGMLLWDANTGDLKTSFMPEFTRPSIHAFAYSPDGLTLALKVWTWNGTAIDLCDAATGRLITTLEGTVGSRAGIVYSPDGGTLAIGSWDTINLWDVNTGRHKATLNAGNRLYDLAYSPDGGTLASTNGSTVDLWDPNTGNRKAILKGHVLAVWALTYSPDGLTLASASYDGTIRLWDTITGQSKVILREHAKGDNTRYMYPSLSSIALTPVGGLAYSPEGLTLASGSGNLINLWDVNTGDLKATLKGERISDVRYSPDGGTLASTNGFAINLWDVNTGNLKTALKSICPLYRVAYSPDGSLLAGTGLDGAVKLWDTATGKREVTLYGHQFMTRGLAYSPDSSTLASGEAGGIVFLWDLTPFIPQRTQPRIATQQTPTNIGIKKYEREMVRLIYFRPSDRPHREDIDTELDTVIKWAQYFYAEQMQHYGDRKTFAFETEDTGYARVHHVTGKFTDIYYHQDTYEKVVKEVSEQFDTSRNVYLIAVDVNSEFINNEGTCGIGGGGWHSSNNELWRRNFGGVAVIPASGICVNPSVTAHELGHVFGLEHDFRDDAYLMAYGTQERLSPCAAEWLDAHRFFNTDPTFFDVAATIEIRAQHAAGQEPLRLRFGLTDPDGLHQAQLLVPTTASDPAQGLKLHSCESLNGTNQTVEFLTTDATVTPNSEIMLQVIDVRGNITKQTFPVADPDAVQAAAVLQLGAVEIPSQTTLLPNYPNPFNPETWIPYQLATSADVVLRIYAVDGSLIRKLALGHLPAGQYQNRGRAAYWDGRNALGERVASGVYFYTLTAGEFTATRRLLISK